MKLFISGLKFKAILGVLEHERHNMQIIIVDIELDYNYDKQKNLYIDYSKVTTDIQNIIIDGKFELIEQALIACKYYFKTKHNVNNVDIKISKPDILSNCVVGARL